MAKWAHLIEVFVLFSIYFCFATYSPYAKWRLTSDNVKEQKFKDLSSNNNDPFRSLSDSNGYITKGVSCACFNSSGSDVFYSTARLVSSTLSSFGISVWINVPAATTGNVFGIGESANTFKYSLDVKSGFNANGNYISTTPFPQDKWVFLAFSWSYTNSWYWGIWSLDFDKIYSIASFLTYPGNVISIGMNKIVYYYEIQVFREPYVANNEADLYDVTEEEYAATTTNCPSACKPYCHPESGCLSTGCCPTGCNCPGYDGVCASCIDSTYDLKTDCQCKSGYILSGGSCVFRNFYIAVPPNCAAGTLTVCSQCQKNYFLYDNSTDSSTICLGNFYLACNSCTTCNASPNCYECIDLIVKDGNTCRVDSIGYQLSFNSPNVIIDFAHPLSKNLKISKLSATTEAHQDIPTTTWTISPSSTLKQYQIVTDLTVDKLPINIDFSFEQIS